MLREFYKDIKFDPSRDIWTVYKVTQGDTKSRGLIVTLILGDIVTPAGANSMKFLAVKPDKTTVLADATIDGDKFIVDFTNQVLAVPGVVVCSLVLYGTDGEKIADKKFKLIVESSLEDGAVISVNERGILDRALEQAEDIVQRLELLDLSEALRVTAELSREEAEALREESHEAFINLSDRVDTIITTPVEGVSAQEIIDARGGEATLGARVNGVVSQLAENATIINQSDFVEIAKSMVTYKGAKFRKYSPDLYEVALYNKNRHMTYRFIKDTNDDFIKLSEVFDGDFTIGFIDREDAVDKFGTWAVATGTNQYTVTPGAGFRCNVKGSRLIFSAYTESRGGLWEFTIDDSLKKEVSVYSASIVSLVEFIIADGLEIDKDHKVVAVFKGDDPSNPPSTAPSRGYATNTAGLYSGTIKGVDPYRTNNKLNIISAATSNKEWAMSIEYAGQYYGFIPDHGIGYAFNVSPPKFLIDGEEFDAPNSDVVIWKELTDFKLVQEIQIIVNSVAVAKVLLTHKLDKSGVVKYSGSLTSLANYKIQTLYPLMLPMNQALLTEAITSSGKSKVSDGNGVEYVFENAEDEILSACGVSETNRDFIIAGKITNPFKTMRIGKTAGKPTERSLFFWQRASYPKIYWRSIADLLMVTGDVYTWSGEIICAKIPNIYNYVK